MCIVYFNLYTSHTRNYSGHPKLYQFKYAISFFQKLWDENQNIHKTGKIRGNYRSVVLKLIGHKAHYYHKTRILLSELLSLSASLYQVSSL